MFDMLMLVVSRLICGASSENITLSRCCERYVRNGTEHEYIQVPGTWYLVVFTTMF